MSNNAIDFYNTLQNSFQDAVKRSSPNEFHFRIAGYNVKISFAGNALIPLITPALRHLLVSPKETPDLTLFIFDSVSTGINPPSPPWQQDSVISRGEITGFNVDGINAAFNVDAGTLSILNSETNTGIFWTRDSGQLPVYEKGAPLKNLFYWWMRKHDRQLIHSAAVGNNDGAALIVGKGGSGKSTTALACLASGLDYLSDDYVLLENGKIPTAHSLYNSGKVNADNLHMLPELISYFKYAMHSNQEKLLFFAHDHFPSKTKPRLPVRLILIPRITGEKIPRIYPSKPSEAMKAMAPSTIFQLPCAGKDLFSFLNLFVRQVPCYFFDLSTDPSLNVKMIQQILSGNLSRE